MSKDKPPPPMVVKTPKGIKPVAAYDQEDILSHPMGTEYDLVVRSKRNWLHLKKYWAVLRSVVHNHDQWPTQRHLHMSLKFACKYYDEFLDLNTMELVKVPNSVSFDKMTQAEFEEYYEIAIKLIAEAIGYDPLEYDR